MTDPNQVAITVGEPNWAPLERAVPARSWRTSCTWAAPARSSCINTGLRGAISTSGGTHRGSTGTSTESTSKSLELRRSNTCAAEPSAKEHSYVKRCQHSNVEAAIVARVSLAKINRISSDSVITVKSAQEAASRVFLIH